MKTMFHGHELTSLSCRPGQVLQSHCTSPVVVCVMKMVKMFILKTFVSFVDEDGYNVSHGNIPCL